VKPRFAIEWVGYRLGAATLGSIPLSLSQGIAARVGGMMFDRGGKRVRWALTNLRFAFPDLSDSELRRIGRSSYIHLAWNALDFARAERWTDDEIRSRVQFEGLEHMEKALEAGRGALGLTLHLGNFELLNLAAPLFGLRAAVVARPMANRRLYEHVVRNRSRTGNVIIDRWGAAGAILQALRSGLAVGILNDQYMRRSRGVFVPLFGRRCSTSVGPAALALRAGAPVLPAYVFRDGPDHHRARIEPPLEPPHTRDRERDIVEYSARMNAALERIIRAHPEQYMWAHRRFRHSPDLEGNPYI
jgi:KDO2-lipid IV(A) lauroyltransferase